MTGATPPSPKTFDENTIPAYNSNMSKNSHLLLALALLISVAAGF